jgi:hypothetical protein
MCKPPGASLRFRGQNAIVVVTAAAVGRLFYIRMNERRDVGRKFSKISPKNFLPVFFGCFGFIPSVLGSGLHACEQEQVAAYGRHY